MDTLTDTEVATANRRLATAWWLFLLTGIAWVLLAFVVLTWDPGTAALIGYLVGFLLIAAGVNELVTIGFVDSWKWLYGVLGATFIVAGFLALTAPFQTFGILALLIGWYLLFKGLASVVLSIAGRHALPLWGLLLAAGLLEMAIGAWAIGYPGRSAWLLVVWIGVGALIRGITEIVLAFELRGQRHEPTAVVA